MIATASISPWPRMVRAMARAPASSRAVMISPYLSIRSSTSKQWRRLTRGLGLTQLMS